MTMTKDPEESAEPQLDFLIGRDVAGHWLAIETHGLAGGFFNSAKEALRFVASDFNERPARIEIVKEIIDPFGRTCVEVAGLCRSARQTAV